MAQLHQVERQIQACENSLREEKEKRRKYYVSLISSLDPKGTGHNKFVRRGPTLSGVGGGGGLSKTPATS